MPNSIAMLNAECASCWAGTKLSGVHFGQVGQPSPDLDTRTPAPVTVMPALTTTLASAHRRIVTVLGSQYDRWKAERLVTLKW
ncbi:hypothetical protein Misp02_38780 [Microtetraspora sp. NBRC 16547]|nr:hypothetical protein Misp02_38780 [Microtetraspora sp. NBRC 16547]